MTVSSPAVAIDPLFEDLRGSAWGPILLLATVLFGAAAMLSVFGPLQESVKHELRLSDVTVSLIQGIAIAAPVALLQVPLSWFVDHGNRVRFLIIMLALCVVGTFWTAFVTGAISLALARMMTALGSGLAVLSILSLVADLCAADRRGRAIVILGMGTFAGAAAAFAVGGALLTSLEAHPFAWLGGLSAWRQTHFLVGLCGALLLAALFFLREPRRHDVEVRTPGLGPAFRAIWAKRAFLLPLLAGQLGITMADTAGGIWAAPVLSRDFHQTPGQYASWVGAMLFVGGVVGSIIGGVTADLGQKSGRRGGLLYAAVAATFLGIPAAAFPIMPSLGGFQILFFLLLLSGAITAIVSSATVTVLIPNEERGAIMAGFGLVSGLIGKSIAPTVVTLGSAAMGGEQYLPQALAVTGVITGMIAFGGYLLAMRNAPLSATDPHA